MTTLLRGGHVVHVQRPTVTAECLDVLVADGAIAALLPPQHDVVADDVIDATGCVVVPGFVDAHRHVWQAAFRGAGADLDLAGYLEHIIAGRGAAMSPDDVHRSEALSARGMLGSGITSVFDWSQIQLTPAHTDAALDALAGSGIRASFGYAHGPRRRADEVRRVAAASTALVTAALAPVGPIWGDVDDARRDWQLADELGLRLSIHLVGAGGVDRLAALGLLHDRLLIVHGNGLTDDELVLVADAGVAACVAPAVEGLMGHGHPETGRFRAAGVATSLSVDTETAVPADMFDVMRSAMLAERLRGGVLTASDALYLATLGGARALGMHHLVGSVEVGKRADLVVLRVDPRVDTDVIGWIVASAGVQHVQTVLVDGHHVAGPMGPRPNRPCSEGG